MGFFTLDLARLVGSGGRVVAVDLQPRMLAGLRRRARRAGLSERIEVRLAGPDALGIEDLAGQVDLLVAVYVVHELPDRDGFLDEAAAVLRSDGQMLIMEPRSHGGGVDGFDELIQAARARGFSVAGRPRLGANLAVLLAGQR